jgi:type I restriction-modification system DNA methylase subunit
VPHSSSQTFLRELDKKLWSAADRLRSNLDAAVYKHAVLGLIFLKYVSDSFAQRQADIEAMLKDPENDFFVDPAGYDKPAQYDEAIHRELEERDYYIEKNVFWVPALARWKTLQDSAKLPVGTEIKESGRLAHSYEFTSLGKLIDDALEAVEKKNPKLKNVPVASVYDRRTLKYCGVSRKSYRPTANRRRLRITVAPFAKQKSIAHILGTLDKKIKLNRRMNATRPTS